MKKSTLLKVAGGIFLSASMFFNVVMTVENIENKIEYDKLETEYKNSVLRFERDLNEKDIEIEALHSELENLIEELNKKEEKKEENNKVVVTAVATTNSTPSHTPDGSWKSYMYYTSLTSKSSVQYKLQQIATTDENGLRKLDDDGGSYYMVATSSRFGNVGDILEIELSSGTIFYAVKGDEKARIHTDETNTFTSDGSIVEFIVDQNLNPTARKLGNCSCLGFEGAVNSIKVIDKYNF